MKTPRKNGFSRPISRYQVLSWMIVLGNTVFAAVLV